MTQEQRVMAYMQDFGSISPMEAFSDLGITKLATVVSRLIHKRGESITKQLEYSTNRYGERVHYMRYRLGE